MEKEDQDARIMEQCGDSSDDEDDERFPVLGEWREEGFGNPVVQDIKSSEFEYRVNEVVQGAKYRTIEDVKDAVKLWAVSLRKEFRVLKSSSKEYEVRCADRDCTWRVHAYKGKFKTHWECSIVTPHTCRLTGVVGHHRNITSTFVAKKMYGVILDKMDYEPALIIRDIEQNFQYVISYAKAWRAKQKVFEMRFGTYEASYDNLPRMLEAIVQRNPGSAFDTYSVPSLSGGPSILLRAFFCIGACVRAFIYCLPVLCIDGTFLTGKYKGTILTAIGIDCNKQIVPIAFAFVENENTESWYWFLERLKIHVVAGRPNVCLISDRHACLLAPIRQLQEESPFSPPIWPDVVSRWCVRHMAANFYERFKNKDLMNLFK